YKGKSSLVGAGFAEELALSLPKGMADKLKLQVVSQQPLLAPVVQGKRIATLRVFLAQGSDMKPWGEFPLVALEAVPVAGIFGRAWDSLMLLFR
ncbi:MAG TPA: D-alanyl-D-alanine carboxypeptidase, partial [Rhodocyclaceae bacterium]|nr:D-alanyl-D-alanine carboxypeptidase [Rhodocyclaceae bacterium]